MSLTRSGSAGFSTLEVLSALVVLLVAVLCFARALTGAEALGTAVASRQSAMEGGRRALEDLQDEDFATVLRRHDADASNDPDGPGTAGGPGFDVEGLTPLADDEDGHVGELLFPLEDGALREDLDWPELGMPRDLNGDGSVDSADHSGDYQLLPVLVRVRWRGNPLPMAFELRTFLSSR